MVPPFALKMVEYEYQHSTVDVHRMVLVVLQYFYCLEENREELNYANIFVDEKNMFLFFFIFNSFKIYLIAFYKFVAFNES